LFWTYLYIYCTYRNYHNTNAFCSMWLSCIVTLVLNSAHGTRTISIDDNRKHYSCRRWWWCLRQWLSSLFNLQHWSSPTAIPLYDVSRFQSIHWLTFSLFKQSSSQSTTPPPIIFLVPRSWVPLLSDPYNNFIQNF